jgi:hypothetical protein
MGATGRLAAVVLAGVLLTGCSETGFQDWFGAGKYVPDESLVQQGQALSTPPDLALRPPGDASQPVQQAYQPPPPPPQQTYEGQQPIYQPQQTYQAPQPQQQQVYQQPQPLQPQPQAATDIYAKWGVSRYRPDGTEKSQPELNEELRQKNIAMERAKNPNYGTIFNMGSIWTDG